MRGDRRREECRRAARLVDFHWLKLRATSHPTEDPERVAAALAFAAGVEVEVDATSMDTHHGAEQLLLEAQMKRNRDIRACLDHLLQPEDRKMLAETLEARIDDDGILYFRVDKQAAAQQQVRVGNFDDPISVRVKVQVHPFRREGAIAAWQAWAEAPPAPRRA